jgi:hypothetical protein
VRILFHAEQLSERGTTTAILEYARHLRHIGFECVIAYEKKHPVNHQRTIDEVKKEFEVIPYRYFWNIGRMQKHFDVGYFIKSGANDGMIFGKTPSIVHAVFQEYQPHGDLYLYVSKWLADSMRKNLIHSRHRLSHRCRTINCGDFEYLDHSVDMPKPRSNFRARLGIKSNEVVGVRYGGLETFDIPFALQAVEELLEEEKGLKFVFANTKRFTDHPNAIFLEAIVDSQTKSDFLNTGDFFLHARSQGESFGLAILEAINLGLPVITYSGGQDLNHLNLVPNQLVYENASSLKTIIATGEYKKHGDAFAEIRSDYMISKIGTKLATYISRVCQI